MKKETLDEILWNINYYYKKYLVEKSMGLNNGANQILWSSELGKLHSYYPEYYLKMFPCKERPTPQIQQSVGPDTLDIALGVGVGVLGAGLITGILN